MFPSPCKSGVLVAVRVFLTGVSGVSPAGELRKLDPSSPAPAPRWVSPRNVTNKLQLPLRHWLSSLRAPGKLYDQGVIFCCSTAHEVAECSRALASALLLLRL